MRKRTREILALALLGALAIVAVAAMVYYILVGHNWNVAASNIDDQIGRMDGYTVLVFNGTKVPEPERQRLSDEEPFLDDQSRGKSAVEEDDAGGGDPLSLDEVAALYREKDAAVFRIRTTDPLFYESRTMLQTKGERVGVFLVDGAMSASRARLQASALRVQGADYVVALCENDLSSRKPPAGIDLMICLGNSRVSTAGGWRGSTYCISTPLVGQVQAVIVSPSGVTSSKTVDSL